MNNENKDVIVEELKQYEDKINSLSDSIMNNDILLSLKCLNEIIDKKIKHYSVCVNNLKEYDNAKDKAKTYKGKTYKLTEDDYYTKYIKINDVFEELYEQKRCVYFNTSVFEIYKDDINSYQDNFHRFTDNHDIIVYYDTTNKLYDYTDTYIKNGYIEISNEEYRNTINEFLENHKIQ